MGDIDVCVELYEERRVSGKKIKKKCVCACVRVCQSNASTKTKPYLGIHEDDETGRLPLIRELYFASILLHKLKVRAHVANFQSFGGGASFLWWHIEVWGSRL